MSGRPVVSVVVPTRGRPGALKRCLESLVRQDYPIDTFEIVIIDDGSPQPVTLPELGPGVSILLRRQPQGGPAAARNHRAGACARRVCGVHRRRLRGIAGLAARAGRHIAAASGRRRRGPVANDLARNPFSEASQALVSFLCEYYNASPEDARFFTSNNLAFPRAALIEAGGFDAQYQRAAAEDRELCDRWRRQGRRLVTAPAALVRHSHNLTLPAFWRQHFSYGTGAWHYWQHRANGQSSRVKVEPLGFYGSLLTWPVRTHGVAGLPVGALLALAQVANAAGFFSEAMRRR